MWPALVNEIKVRSNELHMSPDKESDPQRKLFLLSVPLCYEQYHMMMGYLILIIFFITSNYKHTHTHTYVLRMTTWVEEFFMTSQKTGSLVSRVPFLVR